MSLIATAAATSQLRELAASGLLPGFGASDFSGFGARNQVFPGSGNDAESDAGSKHPLGFDLEGDVLASLGLDASHLGELIEQNPATGNSGKVSTGSKKLTSGDIGNLGGGVHHAVFEGDIEDLSALGEVISTKTYNRGLEGGIIKHTIIDGGFIDEDPQSLSGSSETGDHSEAAIGTNNGNREESIAFGNSGFSDFNNFNRDQISDTEKIRGNSFVSQKELEGKNSGSGFSGSRSPALISGQTAGGEFKTDHDASKAQLVASGIDHNLSGGKFEGEFEGSREGSPQNGHITSPVISKLHGSRISSEQSLLNDEINDGLAQNIKLRGSVTDAGISSSAGTTGGSGFVSGLGLSSGQVTATRLEPSHELNGSHRKLTSRNKSSSKLSGSRFSHRPRVFGVQNSNLFGSGQGSSTANTRGFGDGRLVSSSFSNGQGGSSFARNNFNGIGSSSGLRHSGSPFHRVQGSILGSGFSSVNIGGHGLVRLSNRGERVISSGFGDGLSGGKFSSGPSNIRVQTGKLHSVKLIESTSVEKFTSADVGDKVKSPLHGLSSSLGFNGDSGTIDDQRFRSSPTIVKGQGIRILSKKRKSPRNYSSRGIGSDFQDFSNEGHSNYRSDGFGRQSNIESDIRGGFGGHKNDFNSYFGSIEFDGFSSSVGDEGFHGFTNAFGYGNNRNFGNRIPGRFSALSGELEGHQFTVGVGTATSQGGSGREAGYNQDVFHSGQIIGSRRPVLVNHSPENPFGSKDNSKQNGW